MTEDEIDDIKIEFEEDGTARGAYHKALQSACPEQLLAQIVRETFNESLKQVAGSEAQSVHWNLIDWAVTRGQILRLIAATSAECPDNPRLKRFLNEYPRYHEGARAVAGTPPAAKAATALPDLLFPTPPDPMKFDMAELGDRCWARIEAAAHAGARLIVVPVLADQFEFVADELEFVRYLCFRIVETPIRGRRVSPKATIALSSVVRDVPVVVGDIVRFRTNLTQVPVIFPVKLDSAGDTAENSELAREFCKALKDRFDAEIHGEEAYPLVIVVAAPAGTEFVESAEPEHHLPGPRFAKHHVQKWTRDTAHSGWQDAWVHHWQDVFITACRLTGAADHDPLIVRRVYRHLDNLTQWCKDSPRSSTDRQGIAAEYSRFEEFLRADLPLPTRAAVTMISPPGDQDNVCRIPAS